MPRARLREVCNRSELSALALHPELLYPLALHTAALPLSGAMPPAASVQAQAPSLILIPREPLE